MPLQGEVLADRPEALEERLSACQVAKPPHASLAFAGRLMAVLGAVVPPGAPPQPQPAPAAADRPPACSGQRSRRSASRCRSPARQRTAPSAQTSRARTGNACCARRPTRRPAYPHPIRRRFARRSPPSRCVGRTRHIPYGFYTTGAATACWAVSQALRRRFASTRRLSWLTSRCNRSRPTQRRSLGGNSRCNSRLSSI